MAAGKSSRFLTSRHSTTETSSKGLRGLDTPSGRNPLEHLLHRLAALSRKIKHPLRVLLGVSPSDLPYLTPLLSDFSSGQLILHPFATRLQGALDPVSNLVVLEDDGMPSLWPVGTADLWTILKGEP